MDTNNTISNAGNTQTGENQPSNAQTSATPNAQTAQGTQASTPAQQSLQGQQTNLESLPADIQEYIKSLRTEAESHRKAKDAEARAKKQAEESRLKEQGEFKTLAEQHEARIKELEPVQESYTKLAQMVNKQISDQIKDWPDELKAFDPGKDAPIEQRLDWVQKATPLLAKMSGAPGQPSAPARVARGGNVTNPPAMNNVQEYQKNHESYQRRLRQTGKYSF